MSLAYKVESWAIACLGEHDDIPNGFKIVHQNEDPRATGNRLVCTAKVGEKEDAGAEPYHVALDVTLKMTERDASKAEAIFGAVEETFQDEAIMLAKAQAANAFAYLQVNPEGQDEKEARKESRTMSRTINLLASEL